VLSKRRDSLKIYYSQSQEMEDYVSRIPSSESCQVRLTSLSEPTEHISSSEPTSFSAVHETIAKIIYILATQLRHI
jgi:type III secretory pathway lipoprotein EscJ